MSSDLLNQLLKLRGNNIHLKRDKWLVLYTFLVIFQPPLLPVALVYVLGLGSVIWLLYHAKSKDGTIVLIDSKINRMMKFFLSLCLYVIVVGVWDMMFFETVSLSRTRISTINQISILSFFELCFIWIILIQCKRRNFQLVDIFTLIIVAGLIQGICAVMAFLLPPVRSYFLMFGDQELFSKEYFLLLRGYGFSINLIDTFGYGMGLIGSYMLFVKWSKSVLTSIISLLIIIFTILVNARTGIVVLGMGIILNFLVKRNIGKSLIVLLAVLLLFQLSLPFLKNSLEFLGKSDNNTIAWIGKGMYQGVLLIDSDDTASLGVEEVSFFDNFIEPPSNTFQYLFGTGHHVYDTTKTLGFRTDIGYLNLLWEFGVVGSFFVLAIMAVFMIGPFFMTKDLTIRKISLLNLIAYFVVLMKAILIGFNPGVFVNYLATFSLYYILSQRKVSDKNLIRQTYESCSLNCNTGI